MDYQDYKTIIVEKQDKILVIKFNNPKKKNCVNFSAYQELARVFREVRSDDSVTMVVITAEGDFFTAGNDLSASQTVDDMDAYILRSNATFREMITQFIKIPQVTVALVNGPCIGIGTTLTALCDMAWCAENAYFATPFTSLGIVPEAAASYVLPLIIGRSKATEMLLFSGKMTADEAFHYHFVSRIFKHSELQSVIWPKLREFADLPPRSLRVSKNLLRMHERDSCMKALDHECDELLLRFKDEEFMEAIIAFASRKSKL